MGWCHAFGPQIQQGCDHAMVAGADSCGCPVCGAVCHGRFAGCSTVWAAGPQQVPLRRTAGPSLARERSTSLVTLAPSNGAAADPVRLSPPQADPNGDLRPLLHAVRAELQVLSRKVDQIPPPSPPSAAAAEVADQTLAAVEALPGRITKAVAKAVADTLRVQHRETLDDLGALQAKLLADAEALRPMPAALVPGQVIQAFDNRFEWLVAEISDRFVLLGNEMARIDRRLASAEPLEAAIRPLLTEVDSLTRALAGTPPTPRPGAVAARDRR